MLTTALLLAAIWSLPIIARRYGRRSIAICILTAAVGTGMLAIGLTP